MKLFKIVIVALALIASAPIQRVVAGSTDPLFVNLLTDEPHRAHMALTFSKGQLDRGHPLTLFFNDRGVLVVSKAQSAKFGDQQKMIAELVAKGATVIVCPMCMQHYGVQEANLVPGAKTGNPELVGNNLFKENSKSLTW